MTYNEFAAAFSSIKIATDLISLVLKAKVDSSVTQKAIELQGAIITLQTAMMSIQAQNQELLTENDRYKKELIAVKNWDSEKQKYALTEIAPGIFVYAINIDEESTEPLHWLCAHCYQDSTKSLLQRGDQVRRGWTYFCPNCKTQIVGPYERTLNTTNG